jgi:hypothetical protein
MTTPALPQPPIARKPETLKRIIQSSVSLNVTLNRGLFGVAVSLLESVSGGKENRQKIAAYLFDRGETVSFSQLSEKEKFALLLWIRPTAREDDTGVKSWYSSNPVFRKEVSYLIDVLKIPKQPEFTETKPIETEEN